MEGELISLGNRAVVVVAWVKILKIIQLGNKLKLRRLSNRVVARTQQLADSNCDLIGHQVFLNQRLRMALKTRKITFENEEDEDGDDHQTFSISCCVMI